jgi:isopenicillin-N epimerase
MLNRRSFFKGLVGTGTTAVAWLRNDSIERVYAERSLGSRDPEAVAADEDFLFQIHQPFTLDRTHINLNNGGVCPSPRVVQDAMRRYLEFSNQAPRIIVTPIAHEEFQGIRVTPNVYTTLGEIDAFSVAMEKVIQSGI